MSSYCTQGPGTTQSLPGSGTLSVGTATWPPEVAHIPPGVEHSTQHTKPNRRVKGKSKGQGLFQFKIKASFLQRNTPHLPLPPCFSESKLSRPSKMNSSGGSPLSPERPPFLAGRADTASPGQGLPSLIEPTRQVPGLAPPHAPDLPAGGLPALGRLPGQDPGGRDRPRACQGAAGRAHPQPAVGH